MAYKFGRSSRNKLDTVNFNLGKILQEALKLNLIDITIITGARTKALQTACFNARLSKCKWPESKHNIKKGVPKSLAIDAAPYVNGKVSYNYNHCCFLAGIILAIAKSKGVKIRWGGNWDMDGEPITDQDFQDLLHYELIEE
jgi:peptidoglycan L-alanyl-D-glutamate endopeptidase CwlK